MLWKVEMNCQCHSQGELVNLTEWYDEFCADKRELEQGDEATLLECPSCRQLWRADIPGKRSVCYAVQIDDRNSWQTFDAAPLVKRLMLHNRKGFGEETCKQAGCKDKVINGSRYCLEHLYASGARL